MTSGWKCMRTRKTKEQVYESCLADGMYRKLSVVNTQRVRDLLKNAEINLSSARTLATAIPKENPGWMNVYTMHYEAVRICLEALAIFEGFSSVNHQCLAAYFCVKLQGLGLDWEFLEEIRLTRNGVNYYGNLISHREWEAAEPRFKRTVNLLMREVKERLRK